MVGFVLVGVCTVVGGVVGDAVGWVGGGALVVTTESVVGATVVLVVVTVVVVPTRVTDSEAVADGTCGAAASGPVVGGPSLLASGNNGYWALPTEPSRPVESPSRNRAAMAAPRIAPTANRPCPPFCASTLCIYRFRKLQSSGSRAKHDVDHISTSACIARTRCHVSASAGV